MQKKQLGTIYFLVLFLKKKGAKNTDKALIKPAIMLLQIKDCLLFVDLTSSQNTVIHYQCMFPFPYLLDFHRPPELKKI